MTQPGLPVSKQELKEIHEAHVNIIWDAHQGKIQDMDAFEEYMNKMAAAHSIITLMAIDKQNGTDFNPESLD